MPVPYCSLLRGGGGGCGAREDDGGGGEDDVDVFCERGTGLSPGFLPTPQLDPMLLPFYIYEFLELI